MYGDGCGGVRRGRSSDGPRVALGDLLDLARWSDDLGEYLGAFFKSYQNLTGRVW